MRDVFDKSKALRFAWRLVRADETIDLDAPDEAPGRKRAPWEEEDEVEVDDGPPTLEQVEVHAERRAVCARIEVMVEHAWNLTDAAAQVAATDKIARQAGKVDVQLSAMEGREGVRMARLFVRHYQELSRAGRKGAVDACFWIELGHAELGELIVEMVRSGNERIASAIGMSYETLEAVEFDKGRLALRLAELLDTAKSWTVRELAADWISAGDCSGVRAVLRRAIRLPHIQIRSRALHALEELTPPALDADDVIFLLEDHVDRRVSSDDDDLEAIDLIEYAESLAAAVVRLKPDGGAWPLLRIADPDHHHGWREALDRDWALATLAAAYPADAMGAIDELAKSWRVHERKTAVDATLALPWDDARPRLLALAADGSPEVAERARDGWLDKTATRCPVEETAGLMSDLLEGPPSDKMLSRLVALRSGSVEARAALVDVLLREAPDREALVLLLFALADDALLRGGHGRRLPYDEGRWGRRLLAAFGAPALEGLCRLCERYPHPEIYGWFYVLHDLLADGTIKRRNAGPLSALAQRFLDTNVSAHAALDVLEKTLGKTELRDLHLKMLLEGHPSAWRAPSALIGEKRDPELDRRLSEAIEAKLAASDYATLDTILYVAKKRSLPIAYDAATKLFAAMGEKRAADDVEADELDALEEAGRILDDAGLLDDAWFDAALDAPETLRYRVAVQLPRVRTKRWRPRLERLMSSTARDGAAAVEAARTLLFARPPIARTDPRLLEVADRAHPAARATLLHDLWIRGCPTRRIAPHVARLVATATEAEIEPLYDMLDRLSPRVLRRLVPAIKDQEVRAFVASLVGPSDEATEWVTENAGDA